MTLADVTETVRLGVLIRIFRDPVNPVLITDYACTSFIDVELEGILGDEILMIEPKGMKLLDVYLAN